MSRLSWKICENFTTKAINTGRKLKTKKILVRRDFLAKEKKKENTSFVDLTKNANLPLSLGLI
jgi:hypothetical protein